MGNKDLRLGKIVYILVIYNISFPWLLPLDSFQFSFCCVTVKTIYLCWPSLGLSSLGPNLFHLVFCFFPHCGAFSQTRV